MAITAERLPISYGESFNAELGAAITAIGSNGGGGYAAVIKGASDGLVIQSAAKNTVVLGFIREEGLSATIPALGDQVAVYTSGVVWAVSGAAINIAVQAQCGPGTAGRVITCLTGELCCGIALTSTAGAGERFPLLLRFYTMP